MCRFGLYIPLVLFIIACSTSRPDLSNTTLPHLVWPSAPEAARIELVNLFSGPADLGFNKSFFSRLIDWFAGADDRKMIRPYAIAVNDNKMIIADPDAATVHLFDLQQKEYRELNRVGDALLEVPIAVALSEDHIFIADSKLNKVFAINHDLDLVFTLDQFQRPTSLAYDPLQKKLYITDTLAHKIYVFDQKGQALASIGERGELEGQFNYPSHIALGDQRIFVNDTMNFRIKIFKQNGKHLNSFGKHGDAIGAIGQSKGVAVDTEGHVYVADSLANRIQIFNQQGDFLLDFGEFGNKPGHFKLPAGLAYWKDKIYVADSYNGRVQVFRYIGQGD